MLIPDTVLPMKRIAPILIAAIIIVIGVYAFTRPHIPAKNPDPNHTHADFAVWVNNVRKDFTDAKYMSHVPTEGEVRDDEAMTESGSALRKYLHLHDGNADVLHRHKPGLTVGEFFQTLGFLMTDTCMNMDDGKAVCNESDKKWRMFINGIEKPYDGLYIFADLDQILLTYGATSEQIKVQIDDLTDEACRYSRTCPERGEPPKENCIADPEVPCVVN